jgi:hypothetical protein
MQYGDLLTLLQLSVGFNFGFGAFSQIRDQIFLSEEALITRDRQYMSSLVSKASVVNQNYRTANRSYIEDADNSFVDCKAAISRVKIRYTFLEDALMLSMVVAGVVGAFQLVYASLLVRDFTDGGFATVAGLTNIPWIAFLAVSLISYLDVRRNVRKSRLRFEDLVGALPVA